MAVRVAVVTRLGGRISSNGVGVAVEGSWHRARDMRRPGAAEHGEHRPRDLHRPLDVEDAEGGAGLPVGHPLVRARSRRGRSPGPGSTGLSRSSAPSGTSAAGVLGMASSRVADLLGQGVGLGREGGLLLAEGPALDPERRRPRRPGPSRWRRPTSPEMVLMRLRTSSRRVPTAALAGVELRAPGVTSDGSTPLRARSATTPSRSVRMRLMSSTSAR